MVQRTLMCPASSPLHAWLNELRKRQQLLAKSSTGLSRIRTANKREISRILMDVFVGGESRRRCSIVKINPEATTDGTAPS